MTRSTRRAALTALTLLTAAVTAACGTSSGSSPAAGSTTAADAPKELRIGYQLVPNGDLVVKHEKWLEKALPNTKITWTKFESGGDLNTAIVAGSIDLGLAGSSPVTKGLSAPLNIAYQVPWIFDVIGDAESLVARNGSGVTDLKSLVGKKVATPFASTSHYSLLAALAKAGVAESSVKIIDLEPSDILAAWTRGDIDAAYVWAPTLPQLQKNGVTLTTSTQVAKDGHPTYDLAVVTTKFAKAYPKAVQTWIAQEDKAVALFGSDATTATTDLAAELNITPAEAAEQIKGLTFLSAKTQASADYLGSPSAAGKFADSLHAAAIFLKSQNKIDAVPDVTTLQAGIDVQDLAAAAGA